MQRYAKQRSGGSLFLYVAENYATVREVCGIRTWRKLTAMEVILPLSDRFSARNWSFTSMAASSSDSSFSALRDTRSDDRLFSSISESCTISGGTRASISLSLCCSRRCSSNSAAPLSKVDGSSIVQPVSLSFASASCFTERCTPFTAFARWLPNGCGQSGGNLYQSDQHHLTALTHIKGSPEGKFNCTNMVV
jgi:hypothetical protein